MNSNGQPRSDNFFLLAPAPMKILLLHLLARAACAALLAVFAVSAFAQYPVKPIRLVVPYPPGGTADAIARSIATSMAQSLGQPIVIDNKPGADGVIAASAVATSPPDGYTLLFATAGAFSFAPVAHKSVPYDPIGDFTPIGLAGEFGYFLFVHPSLPVRNMREFVSYAKANPGKLNHGSANTTALIMSSNLGLTQKLDFQQVPYKGEATLAPDFLSGRIQFAFGSAGFVPSAKEGSLRAIATLLPVRSTLLPEVQTFAEAGLTPPPIAAWTAFAGPAKLPPEIVTRLSRALNTALDQPEVRERFAVVAGQVRQGTPEQLSAFIKEQLGAYRKESQAAGIKPE